MSSRPPTLQQDILVMVGHNALNIALLTVRAVVGLQVTAVLSVGLAEGSSHVNWKKIRYTIVWWAVGFGVVMLCTVALVAQGMPASLQACVQSAAVYAV